ncbi:MAG: hypothetical protein LBR32_06500, partial [Propionibacteriaceae bacterium]|nr:hypothetical protein [Propionibacteriaceae bacterium]
PEQPHKPSTAQTRAASPARRIRGIFMPESKPVSRPAVKSRNTRSQKSNRADFTLETTLGERPAADVFNMLRPPA